MCFKAVFIRTEIKLGRGDLGSRLRLFFRLLTLVIM